MQKGKTDMELIEEMLKNTKTIAVIGIKNDEISDAYKVPYYMQKQGYKIYPVNPKYPGENLLNESVYSDVTDITDKIDLVNIFRRPEFLKGHAEQILRMKHLPKYVWFQLGIYNDEAAKILEDKGLKVVQNRCIMVEHTKL